MTHPDEFDLDAAFEAARAQPPRMPGDLRARILEDAQANLPRPALWRRMMVGVGGPAGLGGLVTSTVAGFWLGFAPPAQAVDPLLLLGATELVSQDGVSDPITSDWSSWDDWDSWEG
jgi:hypothetical protein